MGYLPQDQSIFIKLTVEQNILAILEFLPVQRPRAAADHRSAAGTIRTGRQAAGRSPRRFPAASGGGLEIARCLASSPKIILLDEPFTGIDPRTINDIQDIISSLRDQGIAILLTDHRERETLTVTNRNYIICSGAVIVSGDAHTVLNDPIAQDLYFGKRFDAGFDHRREVELPSRKSGSPTPHKHGCSRGRHCRRTGAKQSSMPSNRLRSELAVPIA